jgi:hypothetical protein
MSTTALHALPPDSCCFCLLTTSCQDDLPAACASTHTTLPSPDLAPLIALQGSPCLEHPHSPPHSNKMACSGDSNIILNLVENSKILYNLL